MYTLGGIKIQTHLDKWVPVRSGSSKEVTKDTREARPARLIKLRPIGFPLKDLQRSYTINVEDEKLFEMYAKDQWLGNTVSKDDYLFDQRIIPDFAFQIIDALPVGEVMITDDTRIEIENPEPPQFLSINSDITSKDVIGHENVKLKCTVVKRYLKDPQDFGEWAPKNILFYGPPGTGKTMTAKALANETDSKLFLVRATDLIGEYVGDGSKRVHELFRAAAGCAPSIIFIDELDAIGLDRSFQAVRGDVAEIVNAILTEMDGIQERRGVVTIAATNNPDMLDIALRSRFEEELEFALPNQKERLAILQHYVKKMPLKVLVDLKKYAKRTQDFSGRDLKEKLLKTALHKALIEGDSEVTDDHVESAMKTITRRKSKPPKEMFS